MQLTNHSPWEAATYLIPQPIFVCLVRLTHTKYSVFKCCRPCARQLKLCISSILHRGPSFLFLSGLVFSFCQAQFSLYVRYIINCGKYITMQPDIELNLEKHESENYPYRYDSTDTMLLKISSLFCQVYNYNNTTQLYA